MRLRYQVDIMVYDTIDTYLRLKDEQVKILFKDMGVRIGYSRLLIDIPFDWGCYLKKECMHYIANTFICYTKTVFI